jgi:hypothetical protein
MHLARRVGGILGVSGVLALGMTGGAGAAPGDGCTFEGEPVGQTVSFIAQEFGHSGEFNPGNAHNEAAPFVPGGDFGADCNPTDQPSPPKTF